MQVLERLPSSLGRHFSRHPGEDWVTMDVTEIRRSQGTNINQLIG
jgi:hypothetical protein